jgi:hypothetical protein
LIIFLLLAVIFAGVWYFLPLSIKVALTKKMNSVFIKSTTIQSPDTKQTKIKNKKTSKKKK